MKSKLAVITVLCLSMILMLPAQAEESFKDLVGPYKVGEVTNTQQLQAGFIVWGGESALFHANGGLVTKPGSVYQELGLNIKLVPGDDFPGQVKDYMEGRTPFLRGTFRMIGMASEVLNSDPRTKPVAFLQLTWSKGDHLVVTPSIKSIGDMKGGTFFMQGGGPHVGMADDVFKTGDLNWDDVNIVWCDDLTGSPNSPAEKLRQAIAKDPNFKGGAFVISPDMIGLSGGLQNTGNGAEGTIAGARVLVSTNELSRSIADVFVVRQDFYNANRDLVTKFAAGYLKGSEKVLEMKQAYETRGSKEYMALLQMVQDIYGSDVIPTLEEDAHGLISDCEFAGYQGNVEFFSDNKSVVGFIAFEKKALDLAVGRGYASVRAGIAPSGLNYNDPAFTSLLRYTKAAKPTQGFNVEAVQSEIEALSQGVGFDDKTIYAFNVNFDANQTDFSASRYGVEFQKVVDLSSQYGNAVFAVVGHVDPTLTLVEAIRAGMQKGTLKQVNSGGQRTYSLNGRPLDISATADIVRAIESGQFDGVAEHNPRQVMQTALNFSRERAEQVRQEIIAYAASQGLTIDPSQIQPVGMGIRDPFIAVPRDEIEAAQNRRVEFKILRGLDPETVSKSDFDLLGN